MVDLKGYKIHFKDRVHFVHVPVFENNEMLNRHAHYLHQKLRKEAKLQLKAQVKYHHKLAQEHMSTWNLSSYVLIFHYLPIKRCPIERLIERLFLHHETATVNSE